MNTKSYPVLIALIVSIGGLLLGISAMISGASEFYRSYFGLEIGSFLEGLAVSAAMAGTFIGNLFAGSLSDKLGRKKALFLAAVLFSFCTLGSGLASNYTFLIISRFIGGFGIGISLLVAPLFIAEFSPSERRGFLVSFNQLNIGIGYMLAYILNTLVLKVIPDPEITWRYMLGIGFIFPAIYIILLFFVPESPRWLIARKRDEEAKKIMKKVGGDAYVEKEYAEIKSVLEADSKKEKPSFGVLWRELFTKRLRLVLLIAFSVAFFQMASGINAVFFFGPKIFRIAGFGAMNAFIQSNLIGIVMVIMTVVSMALIDRLGRKPLLLIGVVIMAVAMLISSYSFNKAQYKVTDATTQNISNTILERAIKNEAKKIDKTFYTVDKIEYEGNQANFYINGTQVGTVDLNTKAIIEAKSEAEFLRQILESLKQKDYQKELNFFADFKAEIRKFSESQILNGKDKYQYEFIASHNGTIESEQLVDDLTNHLYSNYKDLLLDNSITINSILVLVSILLIVVGFSISLGPITWALLSEVFPSRLRGIGISVAGALNGLTSFFVGTLFPIELEQLGAALTFLIFAGFMVLCILTVLKWYPETKGKTLEQIEKELIKE